MSLLIGLDGSRIAKEKYTGTEHYSHIIFEHIFRVAPNHRYIIYAPKPSSKPLNTGNAQVEWKIIPFPRLWTQFRLSAEMLKDKNKLDVLFIPSHTIPLAHPNNTVVTVHDLGFKYYPEYYGKLETAYQNFGLKMATKNAKRIIAISEATKKDILKFSNFDSRKIDVIHHGVDQELFRPSEISEKPSRKISSNIPYIYTVGRLEAKKNTPELIKAFRILAERYNAPHKLVLAGKPGAHGYDQVQKALDELPPPLRKRVIMPGYVSNEENAEWLRFATCFAFVSGFEGFGMPILEAMGSGTPVVSSDKSSLPEVVGDAGLLVNHTRAEAIADGIRKILTDKKFSATLINKGRLRAKTFTWESAARKTIATLEQAAK
ncbi:glycosyltransferase family 4 protein [Candidatus Berkelbacteria bacterium]|nr:glycosyltransferase family 4 protein [Candidatus Berkelbacteria bacterium]